MTTLIFDKTDKGREEISTRQFHLASRLRTLLLLADGKTSKEDLLKRVSGLGLTESNLIELVEQDFIQVITSEEPVAATATPASNTKPQVEIASATSAPALQTEAGQPAISSQNAPQNVAPPASRSPAEQRTQTPLTMEQVQALHQFFNGTIKSTIGLRGVGLQLKAERAATLQDFLDLRQPYLDAVLKSKGEETARALKDRLDSLLSTL